MKKKAPDTEFWSVCEYASVYGVSEKTVRRMIKDGRLEATRKGRGPWRIPKNES